MGEEDAAAVHVAAGDLAEVFGPVAGEPGVHAGRHVDDAALHPGLRGRHRHLPQQELGQQEVAEVVGRERHLHAVLRQRQLPVRELARIVSAHELSVGLEQDDRKGNQSND